MSDRTASIPVIDTFGVANDPKMPFLAQALNPVEVQRRFDGELRAIRVVRYKPQRRCLIEYDVDDITLVGKVRAKGLNEPTYRLQEVLWKNGFGSQSEDGISVPEPILMVPEFQMWLQRKAPGVLATRLLAETDSVALARRIAEAVHKLHKAGISPTRRHTLTDELRILHERLPPVAATNPHWAQRLEQVLDACDRLAAGVPESKPVGSHRDFYADHVIVDGPRLYLIDFDLYCEADPGLDVGNFIAHLTEQSLRTLGDPRALVNREQALEDRFVELAGDGTRAAVRAYAMLTLVRHIHISTLFADRQPFTERLLAICEQRLGDTL